MRDMLPWITKHSGKEMRSPVSNWKVNLNGDKFKTAITKAGKLGETTVSAHNNTKTAMNLSKGATKATTTSKRTNNQPND